MSHKITFGQDGDVVGQQIRLVQEVLLSVSRWFYTYGMELVGMVDVPL
jgi:hypothetical protein